jgi:uncharacterized protein YukE
MTTARPRLSGPCRGRWWRVASLTPSDVKHWDPDAIHQVFQTASNRAQTLQRLGDNLQQVGNGLSDWHGEAGEAFHADLGQTRRDVDADGQESRQVAAAVSAAEADVRACKSELDSIQHAVDANHWAITSDWRIDVGNTLSGPNSGALAVEQQLLQGQLDAVKAHAHNADHELAMAIRSAVGGAPAGARPPAPGSGPQAQGQPKPQTGQPKSWQDMLLPTGAANEGDAAKGPPVPAGAGGGKPPSLEDMMLGKGTPAHEPPPPGSLPDLLSRLPQPGAPGGAPKLQPNSPGMQSFLAAARREMSASGTPPDQVEAKLNAMWTNSQQWLDDGGPHYLAPEGEPPPKPGLAEGFGDTWFGFEDTVHKLTGQEGLGAMGDAWGGMAKGFAGRAEDLLLRGPVAPINDLTHEFKNFSDNPSYYLGGKGAEGAIALPSMLFGPEGTGIAEVADADALAYAGMTHPPNVPIGFDSPTTYQPWSESAAQDLYSAFAHGQPTASLNQTLSDMVTHYFGDDANRVVLGRWDGQEGGYIGEARGNGGIIFDTGDPTWKALAEGLDTPQEQALVWPVNEQFLRTQMENHVGRIDYLLDTEKYSSLEDMMMGRAGTYSAMEVDFLSNNAAAYGYERVGNSWVYVGRG